MLRPVFAVAIVAACACLGVPAQPVGAPDFEQAYRAWEVVTAMARHHRDPALGGACASTFRAVAVPALRRQTPQEQAAAAGACQQQARALCANRGLARTPDVAAKCADLR